MPTTMLSGLLLEEEKDWKKWKMLRADLKG
jgi:hypothetical protein